ncbi:hypothetical protein D187_002844 [Cystobacter fuscus DSM 2262]|uniref:Uncharacterized protein n=1 Tax=Cystobacter fuscus (strain ATCC 25194 / DSM 2262 / NBRC 100088 / M29) TaxID=1242864 RepID=S9QDC7_CYSF2|nr:hypothetical protein [Cystobacter fuscus]EPX59354.1 hypothetical protein D187_002844 [Cystobacter fuscus DSM 2262]
MFNGLRWLESLLERAGLGGVVAEAYGALRGRAPCKPSGASRPWPEDVPRVAPRQDVPAPVAPAGTPLVPPPAPRRPEPLAARPEEERPREVSPATSPRAPREKKAAAPKKKATTTRTPASERNKKAARGQRAGAARAPAAESEDVVGALVDALRAHPRQEELVAAGRRKDQLLRSLIPLYLARAPQLEVTSGTTSRFWGELGVAYAAPNAAKALRLNAGFTQDTPKGKALTPKGVKYVESALTQLRSSGA